MKARSSKKKKPASRPRREAKGKTSRKKTGAGAAAGRTRGKKKTARKAAAKGKPAKKKTTRKAAAKGKSAKKKAARKTKTRSKKKAAARRSRSRSRPRSPFESAKAAQTLLHLEDLLHERILGKDDAVERIARALRIRLTNLDFRPERPNGSFLMVGPPGVGKNEFAYALARILYNDERVVAPIDMRAISSEEETSRLTDTIVTGPQPILLEGVLTTPVRRRPHSILLLQGIEHAHPTAHRMIQHIVTQGWIDDARGRVSFEHTIIFATSRVPEDESGPTSQIGFTRKAMSEEERTIEKMIHRLGEEFIEAFEEVIVLPPLTPQDVRKIARYKVEVVLERLHKGRRGVEVSDMVFLEFIPDEEAQRAGAGMLTRTLERKLLNPLARYLLEHPREREIRVDVRDGSLVIETGAAVKPKGAAKRLRA